MYISLRLLTWIWQLPQNILGALITFMFCEEVAGCYVWRNATCTGSVSLGDYIILGSGRDSNTLRHEQGHAVQSLYLGPLYLIVIGVPSIIWAACWCSFKAVEWMRGKGWTYYGFYTERWADSLGGVYRNE